LEREHPLQVLAERAQRAGGGQGSVVLVAGEPGIGKTSLLRAFAVDARLPVLWGMCDPLSTPRPLGPLRDVAADLGDGVPAALAAAGDRHEIFAAALTALRTRPRVFVVEDLHWADEATLDLVRFLARRIADLPLLLAVSYRDGPATDHPLAAVLGDLVAGPDARRLALSPLSRTAVATLLAGSALAPEDVHRRTAGNPFYVSQIAAQPDLPLPVSVRDAVLGRLAGLSAPARSAAELLAVAPEGVPGPLLAALALPEGAVGALAGVGLLERFAGGVAYRHELARLAVLDAVAPGAEGDLHARMIDALEAVDGDPSALAHHAAAIADVPRILRHARTAAVAAARSGAHREARAHYELLLSHVDGPAERATVLEALAREFFYTDALDRAVAAREEALRLRAACGDLVAVSRGHAALAGYAWVLADHAGGRAHADAAVRILSGRDDPAALGRALAIRAYLAVTAGEVADGRRDADRAVRLAAEVGGDPILAGFAGLAIGLQILRAGDLTARAMLRGIHAVGLEHNDVNLAASALITLNHVDVEAGRWAEAEEGLAELRQFCQEHEHPVSLIWEMGMRARLRLVQGQWEEAARHARAVLERGAYPLARFWPHWVLGLLAARRDGAAANPHLDELWVLAKGVDNPSALGTAAAALAEQAWILDRPDPRLDDVRLDDPRVAAVLADAVAGAVTADTRYDRARRHCLSGTTEDLQAALVLLDDVGGRAVAARVRARLRERGVAPARGPLPETRANPAGLTDRQLEVLRLLVQGASNADIAAKLVISPKTADHHVSAVLGKLQARSRGEAAAIGRRLGL
jgi:DNA-binding CsgD family transcriptional regulator